MQYYIIQYPNCFTGSIIISFSVGGSLVSVNSTLADLCGSVSNGTSFAYNGYSLSLSSYMTVGGATYYGVACGVTDSSDDDEASGLSTAILVAIILSSTAILLFIVALVVWKCKSNEKSSNSGKN